MATQQLDRTLGAVIDQAMTEKGYGSRRLGNMLGVSKSTVNFWRQGKHPESWRLDHIAIVLDLDADELWDMYQDEVRAEAPSLATLSAAPDDSANPGYLKRLSLSVFPRARSVAPVLVPA